MNEYRPILVTGSHRSGTTWVGTALALAAGTRYVQEPFNRETFSKLGDYQLGNMYAYAEDEDPDELKKGYLAHVAPKDGERLILKDPIALFSSLWIQENFDAKVVCLVRHPAGFVSSLIKWDWRFRFWNFTRQVRLMDTFPPEIREKILEYEKSEQEPVLQACLLWKAIYGWVDSIGPERRGWIVAKYEDLAAKPAKRFRKLYRETGLDWTWQIKASIEGMSGDDNPTESDDPGFKARNSRAMKDVWKTRLSAEQIELVKSETDGVWQRYYTAKEWRV